MCFFHFTMTSTFFGPDQSDTPRTLQAVVHGVAIRGRRVSSENRAPEVGNIEAGGLLSLNLSMTNLFF